MNEDNNTIDMYSFFYTRDAIGKSKAMQIEEVAKGMNVSVRQARRFIQQSREQGQIICSTFAGGYFIPTCREEIEEFLNMVYGHIFTLFRVIKSAQKWADILEQKESGYKQLTFEEILQSIEY